MFRMINKLKNRKGFTLIELIVVLAVLAIIMAIAVPRFLGVQAEAKVNADYATVAGIAKAAELYYAQKNTEPTMAQLVSGGYLEPGNLKLQATNQDLTTGSAVTIDINTTSGAVKVDVSGSSAKYPDNR